jgi:hypothetical protein
MIWALSGTNTKIDMAPLNMKKFATEEFMEIYGIALARRSGIGTSWQREPHVSVKNLAVLLILTPFAGRHPGVLWITGQCLGLTGHMETCSIPAI